MESSVAARMRSSKGDLFEHSGAGLIVQSGGEVLDESFTLPTIELAVALPSIETFVVTPAGEVSAMGANDDLNHVWMPAINNLTLQVHAWASSARVEFTGNAYVTASITRASEVNGEAHFDDDQFDPSAGVGLVAIVGDIDGPRIASGCIRHDELKAHSALRVDDELAASFANGSIAQKIYGPNELVVLPQFGQLHAGPGPLGTTADVRHLLVFRAQTSPNLSGAVGK